MDLEIQSFDGLWEGGYFEGNPLDVASVSHYSAIDNRNGYPLRPAGLPAKEIGYISVLYATYLTTIRRQVGSAASVLEIGPGRGGWTKALLTEHPKKIYALDALSAEHNKFWEYVGHDAAVEYHQVENFDCDPVPDDSINFFFSFGVFCHISRRGTASYFDSISKKMKSGAKGHCMISDYNKMNAAMGTNASLEEHQDPYPGRWFHLGIDWFCEMLQERGFEILDPDIEVSVRDPMTSFRKR